MQLELDGWKLRLTFSAAHIIIDHERCGKLHGHDYAIGVKLDGSAGADGVVMDFSELKGIVKDIAKQLDHRFIVAKRHENVTIKGDMVVLKSRGSTYQIPLEDCAVLDINQASAEELSQWVAIQLKEKLKARRNLTDLSVKIEESRGQSVWLSVKL